MVDPALLAGARSELGAPCRPTVAAAERSCHSAGLDRSPPGPPAVRRAQRSPVAPRWLLLCGFAALVNGGWAARLVQEINSAAFTRNVGQQFATIGGKLYMDANNNDGLGNELWTLSPDGTLTMAADIYPGAESGNPEFMTEFNGKIYFSAKASELAGTELMALDLDTSVVSLAADICAGPCSSSPAHMVVLGSELFFSADDGQNGRELWAINATGHVSLVHEFDSTSGRGGKPEHLTVMNGTLYMSASTPEFGEELWAFDRQLGPRMVLDLRPGTDGSDFQFLVVFKDSLYFAVHTGRWGYYVYDGHNQTTLAPPVSSELTEFYVAAVHDNELYLLAIAENDPDEWYRVFRTNGTAVSVHAADLTEDQGNSIYRIFSFNGSLVVQYQPDGAEYDLAATTATAISPLMPQQGTMGSNPTAVCVHNGSVYFFANDGSSSQQFWMYNATSGATLIADSVTQAGTGASLASPLGMVSFDGQLLLSASSTEHGAELWAHESSGEFRLVQDIASGTTGSYCREFEVNGDTLYMACMCGDGQDCELWAYNSTLVWRAADVEPGATGSNPYSLVSYDGVLYFGATTSATGNEMFYLTDTGAQPTVEFNAGAAGTPFDSVLIHNGVFFFNNIEFNGGRYQMLAFMPGSEQLIAFDALFLPGTESVGNIKSLGDDLVFTASTPSTGTELWRMSPMGMSLVDDLLSLRNGDAELVSLLELLSLRNGDAEQLLIGNAIASPHNDPEQLIDSISVSHISRNAK
ncbi:hypothetical protein FNF31_01152 [Cafeteria roenbergensis]|uniref:Uncharacterized protein n=1 Tax=Cafeteria roenbergensis TaxID=33653 RepID=A0A5A8DQ82_CAFRO|nr:hypothetical protein FNF31_01152 [Cafeteria roenbergensis]